jgi:hypothetical protein
MKGRLESTRNRLAIIKYRLSIFQTLSKLRELDPTHIQSKANETEKKISQIMKIYVGDQADSSETTGFLCLT